MKSLPLPIRLAAGLAVTARERARDLPKALTGLPVTVASQLLQASMRLQQQVTELAIKGDEALSGLSPVEETPSWATFDEDLALPEESGMRTSDFAAQEVTVPSPRSQVNGQNPAATVRASKFDEAAACDPWEKEAQAMAEPEPDAVPDTDTADARVPEWLPDYDVLSLPQVRARLRQFSKEQLAELLAYERRTANRPSFSGMLERRIETVAKRARETGDDDKTP